MAKSFFIFLLAFVFCTNAHAEAESKTEVDLSCPVNEIYLDGSAVDKEGKEDIHVMFEDKNMGDKNGKPQIYTITKSEIISNKKNYKADLILHSQDYIIVAYGSLIKEGLGSHLITATYTIDLQTKKMRRILSFFPKGKDLIFEGQCK